MYDSFVPIETRNTISNKKVVLLYTFSCKGRLLRNAQKKSDLVRSEREFWPIRNCTKKTFACSGTLVCGNFGFLCAFRMDHELAFRTDQIGFLLCIPNGPNWIFVVHSERITLYTLSPILTHCEIYPEVGLDNLTFNLLYMHRKEERRRTGYLAWSLRNIARIISSCTTKC